MEDDSSEAARLGEILVTMLQSGATSEVLGRFALLYRNKLTTAGQPAALGELGPVLESFSESVVAKVLARVGAGLPVAAPSAKSTKTAANSAIVKLTVNGKRTSISLPQSTLQRCMESLGKAQTLSMMRELAGKAPADGTRSGYVQAELQHLLEQISRVPAPSADAPRH